MGAQMETCIVVVIALVVVAIDILLLHRGSR